MNVVIVGAGCVGQVIGHALQRGGARISFVVRCSIEDGSTQDFLLYRRGLAGGLERLTGVPVYDRIQDALDRETPDLVVLAVASGALREGSWLVELGRGVGKSTVLSLQPGVDDRAKVTESVPSDQVVGGMFGALAYFAPLKGEPETEPGVAFWVPPGGGVALEGAPERARAVAAALRSGGMPARIASSLPVELAQSGAVLDPVVSALKASGWSLGRLAKDQELLALCARAITEAVQVVSRHHGAAPPRWTRWVRPTVLRLLLGVAPLGTPFELADYLELHYTKLDAQRREGLALLQALGERYRIATIALRCLAERAQENPSSTSNPISLHPDALARLGVRRHLRLKPRAPFAVKRNVQELTLDVDSETFAAAFERAMTEREGVFGPIRIKRAPGRAGAAFEVGERFHGCFSLEQMTHRVRGSLPGFLGWTLARLARTPAARRLEDALLSDYAEILEIDRDASTGRFRVRYGYLEGAPIAGESEYVIEPRGPRGCILRSIFSFQEVSGPAVGVLHRFGVRQHDRVVLAQARRAADIAGARIVAHTLRV